MSSKFSLKILAGAVALAMGGTALANTSIDTATGDLFLNIVDNVNQTSYLFDTGIAQSSFSGSSNQNFNLSSDSNYTSFITASGTDSLSWSVLSGVQVGSGRTSGAIVLFTDTDAAQTQVPDKYIGTGITLIRDFVANANGVTSASTTSVKLDNTKSWNNPTSDPQGGFGQAVLGTPFGLFADIGSSLYFYSETTPSLTAATTDTVLTSFDGQWNLTGSDLSFTAPVPLPAGLPLLLSALGGLGLLGRRSKKTEA